MAETSEARLGGASHDSPAGGGAVGSPMSIRSLSADRWRMTFGKNQWIASGQDARVRVGGWDLW